jgi:hypothetical protein
LEHVDPFQPTHWEFVHALASPINVDHYARIVRNDQTVSFGPNLNGHYFY